MKITRETESYNHRRYSAPWIAKVDFSSNKGEFIFGDWVGDKYNGSEGTLVIEVNINDIVAIGQKDYRNNKNSTPDFYVVTPEGNLNHLGNKNAAFKFFNEKKKVNVEELLVERENLLKRISEINSMLGD